LNKFETECNKLMCMLFTKVQFKNKILFNIGEDIYITWKYRYMILNIDLITSVIRRLFELNIRCWNINLCRNSYLNLNAENSYQKPKHTDFIVDFNIIVIKNILSYCSTAENTQFSIWQQYTYIIQYIMQNCQWIDEKTSISY